jgi:hypothetical protein
LISASDEDFPETRRAHLLLYRLVYFIIAIYESVCSFRQCYIFMTVFNRPNSNKVTYDFVCFRVRDFVVVVGLTGICRRLLDDKTTIFWACRALGTSKCLLIGDYQLHDLRFYTKHTYKIKDRVTRTRLKA